jgi:hypothetical protein
MNVAFPDIHWDVRDTVVEGDRIATFSFWTGTHRGEFMGIPATGRSVRVEAWTWIATGRPAGREPHHHGRRRVADPARRHPGSGGLTGPDQEAGRPTGLRLAGFLVTDLSAVTG